MNASRQKLLWFCGFPYMWPWKLLASIPLVQNINILCRCPCKLLYEYPCGLLTIERFCFKTFTVYSTFFMQCLKSQRCSIIYRMMRVCLSFKCILKPVKYGVKFARQDLSLQIPATHKHCSSWTIIYLKGTWSCMGLIARTFDTGMPYILDQVTKDNIHTYSKLYSKLGWEV